MSSSRVARRYAAALMGVADTSAKLAAIGKDVESLGAVLGASRELVLMLQSPVISPRKKTDVLEAIFTGKLTVETAAFLRLLVAKRREEHLPEIVVQFRVLRDQKEGTVPAEVVSAIDLTAQQKQQLERELEAYTKKQIRLRQSVDPAIRAGLVVRLGDTVLDGSLRRQLELLRTRLVEGAELPS
jgi:F-type H+-transporting ATPase subunit delta